MCAAACSVNVPQCTCAQARTAWVHEGQTEKQTPRQNVKTLSLAVRTQKIRLQTSPESRAGAVSWIRLYSRSSIRLDPHPRSCIPLQETKQNKKTSEKLSQRKSVPHIHKTNKQTCKQTEAYMQIESELHHARFSFRLNRECGNRRHGTPIALG